VQKFF